MQEVGCPEPAAVVDIMERMLSRFAFSLIASMVDADGPVALVALKRPSLRGSTLDFTCFGPDRRQRETYYQTEAVYLKSVLLWLQEYWTAPAVYIYPLRAMPQGAQHGSARRTHTALNRRDGIIGLPALFHPEARQRVEEADEPQS